MFRRWLFRLTGILLITGALLIAKEYPLTHADWLRLSPFIILGILSEVLPLILPNGTELSLAPAVIFASMLVSDPLVGPWVTVPVLVASSLYRRHLATWSALYHLGRHALAAALAGLLTDRLVTPGQSMALVFSERVVSMALIIALTDMLAEVWHNYLVTGSFPRARLRAEIIGFAATHLYSLGAAVAIGLGYLRAGTLPLVILAAALWWSRHLAGLLLKAKRSHRVVLATVVHSLGERVGHPDSHAAEAGQLARMVARQLRLSEPQQEMAETAGLLHDIGEAHVPVAIIRKVYSGKVLTLQEAREYQNHVKYGHHMLRHTQMLPMVAQAILHHHERWDGSGYPGALSGTDIPLLARIIGGVEAYLMACTQKDTPDRLLNRLSGTSIDPAVAAALREVIPTLKPLPTPASSPVAPQEPSAILDCIDISQVLLWSADTPQDPLQLANWPVPMRLTHKLCQQVRRRSEPCHKVVRHHGKWLHLQAIPAGTTIVTVATDVSALAALEGELRLAALRAYRELLPHATGAKVYLLLSHEVPAMLAEGELLSTHGLNILTDLAAVRRITGEVMAPLGLPPRRCLSTNLAVSEASTNVFKHAGQGQFAVRRTSLGLRFIITDSGPGIPMGNLPKVLLQPGFSTQVSLGRGFSVIQQNMDRIYLATDSHGTTLLLDLYLPALDTRCSSN